MTAPRARLTVALVAVILLLWQSHAVDAADTNGCANIVCAPGIAAGSAAVGEGYLLTISGRQQLAAAEATSGVRPGSGPRTYYDFTPVCAAGGVTQSPGTPQCFGAVTPCPSLAQTRYLVFAGPSPTNLSQVPGLTVCFGPLAVISPALLAPQVDVQIQRYLQLPPSSLHTAPPGATLVNLPTVFWATLVPPGPVSVVLGAASVTIAVSPRYLWTFGDGSSITTTTPGLPYRESVSPVREPGYYLEHAYLQTSRGTVVTLTVTWSPSYTVAGVRGSFTAAPIVRTASMLLPVRQARAVLTGNR